MSRPHKGGDDKRVLVVRCRMTAAEKIQLEKHAADSGLTTSDFIRGRTLGAQPHTKKASPEREAFIVALAGLGKIGSNVNQIARAVNRKNLSEDASEVDPALIRYALNEITALTKTLYGLLENGR